jgi:hypothetical protein
MLYTNVKMNHKTTIALVAIAAIAATLLAASTIATVASDKFAFAHKKHNKADSKFTLYHKKGSMGTKDNGISQVPYKQIIICITTGQNSPNACTNTLNIRNPGDLVGKSPITSSPTNPAEAPTKESTTNLGGSYPAAANMKSSNTNPVEDPMNTWQSTSVEFPFG